MNPVIPLILGVLAAIVTALGAFAIARRTTRGTVKTAEAETVFKELGELKDEFKAERDYYRTENQRLQGEVEELKRRVSELERLLERRGGGVDRRSGD